MLRLMVVGLGYWGPNLVRALTAVRGANLVAVADCLEANLERIRTANPGLLAVTDFRSCLHDVDAVMLATPPSTHHGLATLCLDAGKHVYIEKPITPGVEEAQDLARLASSKGLVVMVGHIYQYAPVVGSMADVVASGELGDILYCSSVRANMGRFSDQTDVVWDLLPHDLCVLKRALGLDVSEVSALGLRNMTPGVEDVAYVMLKLSDGTYCHVHDSWYEPIRTRRFTIVGTRAALVLDESRGTQLTIHEKGARNVEGRFEYFDRGSRCIDFAQDEPLVVECQHFVDCIANKSQPRTDVADAVVVLRTIEAVHRSLDSRGAWVSVCEA